MYLIETRLRRCGMVVAFRGPAGWLEMNLPTLFWSGLLATCCLPDLVAAWFVGGAGAEVL